MNKCIDFLELEFWPLATLLSFHFLKDHSFTEPHSWHSAVGQVAPICLALVLNCIQQFTHGDPIHKPQTAMFL